MGTVSDERILGGSDFVTRLFLEAEEKEKETLRLRKNIPDLGLLGKRVAKGEGISWLLEKVVICRLLKNAQVQGARNPESGVATNKEQLLPRRRVGESARSVLGRTLQRRRMRETQQMGVFQQPAREDDLRSGSRRREVIEARRLFCQLAVRKMGYCGGDVARFLGVTTSAVNKAANSEEVAALEHYSQVA